MSHKKFGSDRFSRLLDTNKQTDTQTNRPGFAINVKRVELTRPQGSFMDRYFENE